MPKYLVQAITTESYYKRIEANDEEEAIHLAAMSFYEKDWGDPVQSDDMDFNIVEDGTED